MGEVIERRTSGTANDPAVVRIGAQRRALIDALGHVPLPPYIKRPDTPPIASAIRRCTRASADRSRRRRPACTSRRRCSTRCRARGIERAEITLHVGYGTFKPVRAERVEEHDVDAERYAISAGRRRRDQPRARDRPPRRRRRHDDDARARGCRDARRRRRASPAPARRRCSSIRDSSFRWSTRLLTNFHLPQSSLLMLVVRVRRPRARAGGVSRGRRAGYRFYSYGDAMLITVKSGRSR